MRSKKMRRHRRKPLPLGQVQSLNCGRRLYEKPTCCTVREKNRLVPQCSESQSGGARYFTLVLWVSTAWSLFAVSVLFFFLLMRVWERNGVRGKMRGESFGCGRFLGEFDLSLIWFCTSEEWNEKSNSLIQIVWDAVGLVMEEKRLDSRTFDWKMIQ